MSMSCVCVKRVKPICVIYRKENKTKTKTKQNKRREKDKKSKCEYVLQLTVLLNTIKFHPSCYVRELTRTCTIGLVGLGHLCDIPS